MKFLLAVLRWCDEHHPDAFVDWYPFDHPQLGAIELGGWNDLLAWTNPPLHLLRDEVAPHADFAIHQALCSPRLELVHTRVERLGDDTWHIEAGIANTGWLSTEVTALAHKAQLVKPGHAELVGEGARLGPECGDRADRDPLAQQRHPDGGRDALPPDGRGDVGILGLEIDPQVVDPERLALQDDAPGHRATREWSDLTGFQAGLDRAVAGHEPHQLSLDLEDLRVLGVAELGRALHHRGVVVGAAQHVHRELRVAAVGSQDEDALPGGISRA